MPRSKSLSDTHVLEIALKVMHASGPEALTFASLSEASGLSPATLVQRFGGKAALKRQALMHAWDGLDERTRSLAGLAEPSPEGAIGMLVALSHGYGDIESYAEGLLMLREDLRDPALRARGARWRAALCGALDDCLGSLAPDGHGLGLLMAAEWQGALLWWSFEPQGPVEDYVERMLRAFVTAIAK